MPRGIKAHASIFTVEVPDLDGDGDFDLVLGGHSWQRAPLRLYLNSGSNNFSQKRPIIVPDPKGFEIVVDVAASVVKGQPILWVLRAGGSAKKGARYVGYAVQSFNLATKDTKVVAARKSGYWAPWIFARSSGSGVRLTGFSTDRLPTIKP